MSSASVAEGDVVQLDVKVGREIVDTPGAPECDNNQLVGRVRGDEAGRIGICRAMKMSASITSNISCDTYFSNSVSVFVSAASTLSQFFASHVILVLVLLLLLEQ